MYISSTIVLTNPALAQMYYAIRSLDTQGCGWVCTTAAALQKITKLGYSTVHRLVSALHVQSWASGVGKRDGSIYVKYVSFKAVEKICGGNSTGVIATFNKTNLKDRKALKTRALLAVALESQEQSELKLRYLMDKGKLEEKFVVSGSSFDKIVKDVAKQRLVKSATSYAPNRVHQPSSKQHQAAPIPKGYLVSDLSYTVGINQQTLAAKTNLSSKTVSRLLASETKIRIYKKISDAETSSTANCFFHYDPTTGRYINVKPMPYIYKAKNVTKRSFLKLKRKARIYQLTPQELQVAKCMAFYKWNEMTEAAALRYINWRGMKRFVANLGPLREERYKRIAASKGQVYKPWKPYKLGYGLD